MCIGVICMNVCMNMTDLHENLQVFHSQSCRPSSSSRAPPSHEAISCHVMRFELIQILDSSTRSPHLDHLHTTQGTQATSDWPNTRSEITITKGMRSRELSLSLPDDSHTSSLLACRSKAAWEWATHLPDGPVHSDLRAYCLALSPMLSCSTYFAGTVPRHANE